jgi:hypothetical protein
MVKSSQLCGGGADRRPGDAPGAAQPNAEQRLAEPAGIDEQLGSSDSKTSLARENTYIDPPRRVHSFAAAARGNFRATS